MPSFHFAASSAGSENVDYAHALRFLAKQRNPHRGFSLGKVTELIRIAGIDARSLNVVHITGTNGKGSTANIIAQILGRKFRTGIYISPHLLGIRERIRVNNRKIPEKDFARILTELARHAKGMRENPSYFEFLTVMAIRYFLERGVEIAVVEVGMGGRLDATNVLQGKVNVFTDISLEHTGTLGRTIMEIAGEKGGIIKCGSTTVISRTNAGFRCIKKIAKRKKSKLLVPEFEVLGLGKSCGIFKLLGPAPTKKPLRVNMAGIYQIRNAALAVSAVYALREFGFAVPQEDVLAGLSGTRVAGRMQSISKKPAVVVDVGHNPGACRGVADALKLFSYGRLILVFGCLNDKDFRKMLSAIPFDYAFISQPRGGRALEKEKIARFLRRGKRRFETAASIRKAFQRAKKIARKQDLILACGSHYVVSEVLGGENG